MGISNPVAIYTAANNSEAHFLCIFLEQNEIESYVAEEDPVIGGWMFGLLPQVHKPKVWIDQSNADRVTPLLQEFESLQQQSSVSANADALNAGPIAVECEDCGRAASFAANLRGTIQDCPHCGAYVDVGETDSFEE
jgi:Zn finger protein HypA/HybF involved in hydrogenase expression